MSNDRIEKIVKSSMLAALCCVSTLISFPLPGGGYANAGDAFVMLTAVFAGPIWGTFAAATGTALADVILGYAVYAPATFVIKGVMALCFAIIFRHFLRKKAAIRIPMASVSAICSEIIMIGGYFAFEYFLYGAFVAAADIPGNALQSVVGVVLTTALTALVTSNRKMMKYCAVTNHAC